MGATEGGAGPRLPVSVPLPVVLVRYGVQVRQGDDVATVGAQPLLIKPTFPVLQLALVFVGDPDVGVVGIHAHAGHGRVVALQELLVHPLVMLRKQTQIRARRRRQRLSRRPQLGVANPAKEAGSRPSSRATYGVAFNEVIRVSDGGENGPRLLRLHSNHS